MTVFMRSPQMWHPVALLIPCRANELKKTKECVRPLSDILPQGPRDASPSEKQAGQNVRSDISSSTEKL